jgi:hypothetical protein
MLLEISQALIPSWKTAESMERKHFSFNQIDSPPCPRQGCILIANLK